MIRALRSLPTIGAMAIVCCFLRSDSCKTVSEKVIFSQGNLGGKRTLDCCFPGRQGEVGEEEQCLNQARKETWR